MSVTMDDSINRWTAKRKTALVIEIIQGKGTNFVRLYVMVLGMRVIGPLSSTAM